MENSITAEAIIKKDLCLDINYRFLSSFQHYKLGDLRQLNHVKCVHHNFSYVGTRKVETVSSGEKKVETTYSTL